MKQVMLILSMLFVVFNNLYSKEIGKIEIAKKQTIAEEYMTIDNGLGSITFSSSGQMFAAYHPFYSNNIRVVEIINKKVIAYPNLSWNTPQEDTNKYIDNVLSIRFDSRGILWVLDTAGRTHNKPKLVGFNTKDGSLYKIISLEALATDKHFFADFAIDEKRNFAIITDEGISGSGLGEKASLVVVNLQTGKAFRTLQSHWSTLPENIAIKAYGQNDTIIKKDNKIFTIGVDAITIDKDHEYVYFAAANGSIIYKILAEKLETEQNTKKLEKFIIKVSARVNIGELGIDTQGNLYTTEIETNSIGMFNVADNIYYNQAVFNKNMHWPESVAYSPDGYIYIATAQINLDKQFIGIDKHQPFKIFRFKALFKGIEGK